MNTKEPYNLHQPAHHITNDVMRRIEEICHENGLEVAFGVRVHNAINTLVEQYQQKLLERDQQYAHEGGKPQVMTADILKRWLAALEIPSMTDIYQTNTPNVFYATFSKSLFPHDKAQIQALGIEVIFPDSPLRNRYMLKWQPPRNDER